MTIIVFFFVALSTLVGNVIMLAIEEWFGQHIASIHVYNGGLLLYWLIITVIIRSLMELFNFIEK